MSDLIGRTTIAWDRKSNTIIVKFYGFGQKYNQIKLMKYSVLVQGNNYHLDVEGRGLLETNFIIWKCVFADNPTDAQRQAIELVQNENTLLQAVQNSAGNLSSLDAIEIRSGWGDLDQDGSGFIFWAEKDEPSESDHKVNFISSIVSWIKERFQ